MARRCSRQGCIISLAAHCCRWPFGASRTCRRDTCLRAAPAARCHTGGRSTGEGCCIHSLCAARGCKGMQPRGVSRVSDGWVAACACRAFATRQVQWGGGGCVCVGGVEAAAPTVTCKVPTRRVGGRVAGRRRPAAAALASDPLPDRLVRRTVPCRHRVSLTAAAGVLHRDGSCNKPFDSPRSPHSTRRRTARRRPGRWCCTSCPSAPEPTECTREQGEGGEGGRRRRRSKQGQGPGRSKQGRGGGGAVYTGGGFGTAPLNALVLAIRTVGGTAVPTQLAFGCPGYVCVPSPSTYFWISALVPGSWLKYWQAERAAVFSGPQHAG